MNVFNIRLQRRNIPEEELLADLRRVAFDLSKKTITVAEYSEKGNYGVNTYLRRFKKWNIALQKAGLEAPNRQHIPDSELFENIATVWISLGRQPYGREMGKGFGVSKISLGTYEKRFGSWNQSLLAFESFIELGKNHEIPVLNSSPHIVRTKKTGKKINWRLRALVLIRDNCICQMCGASPSKDSNTLLHVDHIKPFSKGGETLIENLRTLCMQCNIGKSDVF